jgi:tetratricopeptide (TPR) repeat protein
MARPFFLVALMGIFCPLASLHAQETKPNKDTTKTQAPATSDQFKQVLRDSLEMIQTEIKEAEKSERGLRFPTPEMFAMSLSKDLAAGTVIAIGRAQAKVGDKAAARATWQSAADRAADISSFDAPEEKAGLFVEIARAQHGAGDREEARFSLRQAIQSARLIKEESRFPLPPPPGFEVREDPLYKKAGALRRIAQAQGEIGDAAGSQETFRAALETADSIKNEKAKIEALVEIAAANPPDSAGAAWSHALDFALSGKDEFRQAKAVATVLRARVKAKEVDGALKTVEGRLKGDLRTYTLWVVADAIASSEFPVDAKDMSRLVQLTEKADYDRPAKKIKVYRRLAEAFARLGNAEQAYRMAAAPNPVNNVQTFHATHARIEVMKEVAKAQIQAKQFEAAKDTVQVALELITGFVDEDAESYFPLIRLGILQAQAGDLIGAKRTAATLASHEGKISILTEIAVKEAEANHGDEARALIQQAVEASRRVPNDAIWRAIEMDEPPGDFDPRLNAVGEIAQAQSRVGRVDEALKTLAEIKGPKMSWGGFIAGKALREIASARLKADDIKGALKAIDALLEIDLRPSEGYEILERITRRQAELGDPQSVLSWTKAQRYPDSKLHALRGLAEGITARLTSKQSTTSKPAP